MIGRSSPRSWAILAFSSGSAMPAASTRMSAMLPGTRRSITKISTDIPNRVSAINRMHRTRNEPMSLLAIQPDVLEAPAVERAVHHEGQVLDIGSPAGRTPGIEDDRPRPFLGQFALDCPYQLLAALLIGLHRLLLDQLIDFRIAVAVPIQDRSASVVQIEDWI